jgi:hypothetical protein
VKIYGDEITEAQIAAGIDAMKGEFTGQKVMKALHEAGVTNSVSAAEAVINRQLKLGNIERITRGLYRVISPKFSN